jgi:hypothetical protein
MPISSPKASQRQPSWTDVKTRLEALDRRGLVGLVHDLYEANTANRRFLQARLLPLPNAVEKYRKLVTEAVFPDPFSQRRVSLRDGTAAITEYRRSTGDVSGTVDLMLTFIEAGTEQAADLGYGDENYFATLENKVDAVAKAWPVLSGEERTRVSARLDWVRKRAQAIGWGTAITSKMSWSVYRFREPKTSLEESGSGLTARWSRRLVKSRAPRLSACR